MTDTPRHNAFRRADTVRRGDMLWALGPHTRQAAWYRVATVSVGRTQTRVAFTNGLHVVLPSADAVRVFTPYAIDGGLSSSATVVGRQPPQPSD